MEECCVIVGADKWLSDIGALVVMVMDLEINHVEIDVISSVFDLLF